MRRIRHHDDYGVGFFRNLLAGFADDAACGNELWRNGPDIVKKKAMSRGLKMASHRTSHGSEANEANINHLIFLIRARLCVDRLGLVPSEAFDSGCLRFVFAANPAAISDLVEKSKQEGIVDLSSARFVAARVIGQLDMSDTSKVLSQRWRDITFHHLHVVDVILNEEIIGFDVGNDLNGLLRPVQKETRNIARVYGLDQQGKTFPRKRVCSEPQIVQKHLI